LTQNKLEHLIAEHNGVLRTADVVAAGIPKEHFYQFARDYGLEKAAHGIYVSPDTLTDEMYLLQLQFPRAVFSHEAALYLHDLAEREPMPLAVSVPANYNSAGLSRKGTKIYYLKEGWYELGITELPTFAGNAVRAYDMERTICDIVRRYDDMDVAVFNYAVREYAKRNDRNYTQLSRYAKALRIERKIWEKMGILF